MAGTGLIMAGFLITHASANLLAFLGPEHINRYSRFLHQTPEILLPARLVLLVSVILHAVAAAQLARRSLHSRPIDYEQFDHQIATVASRSIRSLSVLLALFIFVHLLHLTTGRLHPDFDAADPYGNLVVAFTTQRAMTLFYVAMMIVVGLHLYHGAWSAIRTLGLSRPRRDPFSRPFTKLLAVGLWLAFTLVPVAIWLGVIRERPAGVIVEQPR